MPQIFLLLMSVVAARFLGPEDMGRQSFIAFVALSVTALFGGGLAATLMRFVGETLGRGREATVRDLVVWSWRLAATGAAIGAAVMIGAGVLGAGPRAAWILAGVGCALGILQSIPNAVLVGAQEWRRAATVGLVTGTAGVPVTIAVLAAGGGIVGIFAVEVVVVAANLVWSGTLALRMLGVIAPRRERDRDLRRRAAAYARWTLLSILLSTIVFKRSEFFLLNHYASNTEIAIYSIAFAAVFAVTTLSESLARTLMPAFATLFGGEANERIEAGFDRAQRLLMMLSLPLAAATIALGPEALALIYGRDYSATGQVVQILAFGIPLLAMMNLSHSFMLGFGMVRPVLLIDGTAAVINLILAFALIPAFHGTGAALANLGGQCTVAVIVTIYTMRSMKSVRLPIRLILINAACAVVSGLAAFFVVEATGGVAGLLAGLAAGIACFVAVGRTIGIVAPDDARWLTDNTSGSPVGGAVALLCRLFTPVASEPER